jgi:hypothetical protein
MAIVRTPALALMVLGCGSDPLFEPDHIRTWATTGSALAVYAHAHQPVGVAQGELHFADANCPQVNEADGVLSIDGDCRDTNGTHYEGRIEVTRIADGDLDLEFHDWGNFGDPDFATRASGTFELRRRGESLHDFSASLDVRGGMTTTLRYDGSVSGGYDGRTVWNGAGTVERDGLVEPTGRMRVETRDQVRDIDVCSNQPLSGETLIDGGSDVAIVTYDGESACDDDQAVRLTVNGRHRGMLIGVGCAVRRGTSGSAAWSLPLLLLLLLRRLTRRPRRTLLQRR